MLIPLAPGSRKPLITIEEYVPEYLLTKLHIKYTKVRTGGCPASLPALVEFLNTVTKP